MNTIRASILVKPHTREELRSRGRKGQTFDDVIAELLRKTNESSNPY